MLEKKGSTGRKKLESALFENTAVYWLIEGIYYLKVNFHIQSEYWKNSFSDNFHALIFCVWYEVILFLGLLIIWGSLIKI